MPEHFRRAIIQKITAFQRCHCPEDHSISEVPLSRRPQHFRGAIIQKTTACQSCLYPEDHRILEAPLSRRPQHFRCAIMQKTTAFQRPHHPEDHRILEVQITAFQRCHYPEDCSNNLHHCESLLPFNCKLLFVRHKIQINPISKMGHYIQHM
jgi:hypothetical protein